MNTKGYLLGVGVVAVSFSFGWFVRGSDNFANAKLHELYRINDSLMKISERLPEQKIVEKEKIVQAPFCDFALSEKISMSIRQDQRKSPATNLEVCKILMDYNHPLPNGKSNTYDAIGEWIKTAKVPSGGLEDTIMAHLLGTLIYCFQNT
jgi:hypothetical protein